MLGTPFIRRMLLLGSALLLIVILGLLPERSFNRARDAEQLVTHTLRVINASGALLSIIEGAETGERGYLLTGEERYLQPYQAALSSYRQASRNLRDLTVDDGVQQARIDKLERLVDSKLAGLSRGIALYRTKGRDAALALVFMGEGKLAMDEIRGLSHDMEQEEQRLLIIRTQAAVESQDTQLKWILRIGGALLVILIAVAGVITERVIGKHERVAVALRTSEERFRTLADAIPQLCWTANADGWILWYNQRWYDFTGKTPEEMEGWGWQSVHDPTALADVLAGWKKAIRAGEPFEMVFTLRAADGAFHPFLTRVMPVRDATGKVVRWFGTNTDITGQRQIEEALAENQERLRLAQEVARIGTFVWNLQTGESQLTPELEAMYGLPPGGFAAGHRTWQDLICPEDRDQGVLYVQEAMEKGSFAAEWRVIWPDGTARWLFGRAWVSKDDTGKPLRLMGANTDVTERKLAELEVLRIKVALAENQERLRLAQEVARIGTFVWNLQTGESQLTPELEAMYGLPPGGFAAGRRTWQDLICPEDRDQGVRYVQEVMETGSFEAEWRVIWPDGTTRWLFGRAWVSKDDTGKPLRLMGANTDVTERKLAELEVLRIKVALAENQERLRLAQEVARIGTFEWNLQTGVNQLTPELEAMYGLPPGGFAAGHRTWQDLICPEDRDQGVRYVHEAMEKGSFAAEWRVIWPDGTTRWLYGRAWVSKDDTGKPLRLMGANTDVTERKLAELELLRVNADLAENQERLRLAQEVARIGTFVWNLQTGESQLTPELEAMYGLPPGGFTAGRRTWQDLICPEDRDQGVRHVHEVMETGSFEAEWRVIWPDGTVRWLFGRAWVFKDAAGKPLRLIGANIDVTGRKLAELEVSRLNAELEQRVRQRTLELEASNRELEAFAYSVSHDLRAPLRGIDGWSLALLEDYSSSLDDNGRQYLNRVRAETQRMGNLIDDLLLLSRVSRGEMKLDQVDITALANRIVDRLRDAQPKRSIEFAIEPGLVAFGDARLLEIALTNLLSNAVKFTGAQNPALIEFGRVDKEGEMAFYVRDNGAGFDMAYAGNLFGAFQRLHKVTEFPGTGIGLATVQRIVRRHGGRVWADARVNRGATFCFTLGAA